MFFRNHSVSEAFLNFSVMYFGSCSSFTRVIRDGVRCEVAAAAAVAAEKKRPLVGVLKLLVARRRRRERDDIVGSEWLNWRLL